MDLIPEYIIDSFCERIKKAKSQQQVDRELERIKLVNGEIIPEKIKKELEKTNFSNENI